MLLVLCKVLKSMPAMYHMAAAPTSGLKALANILKHSTQALGGASCSTPISHCGMICIEGGRSRQDDQQGEAQLRVLLKPQTLLPALQQCVGYACICMSSHDGYKLSDWVLGVSMQ
jgi:hypothetical protein